MNPGNIAKFVAVAATASVGIGAGVQDHVPEQASDLVEYQIKCNRAHAFLDGYIFDSTRGKYAFTDGEAHRPEITAKAYARLGIGIAASLHTQRLARDKMLIVDGVYTTDPKQYELPGLVWEAIGGPFGIKTAWGGRFGDANHFSCAWAGRK